MNHYVILALGVIAAGVGGELFVRGAVGLGQWARISPGLIGATIAALATSSPEWSVGISSALMGAPQISLGTPSAATWSISRSFWVSPSFWAG